MAHLALVVMPGEACPGEGRGPGIDACNLTRGRGSRGQAAARRLAVRAGQFVTWYQGCLRLSVGLTQLPPPRAAPARLPPTPSHPTRNETSMRPRIHRRERPLPRSGGGRGGGATKRTAPPQPRIRSGAGLPPPARQREIYLSAGRTNVHPIAPGKSARRHARPSLNHMFMVHPLKRQRRQESACRRLGGEGVQQPHRLLPPIVVVLTLRVKIIIRRR